VLVARQKVVRLLLHLVLVASVVLMATRPRLLRRLVEE
jgi:hypothetical protein